MWGFPHCLFCFFGLFLIVYPHYNWVLLIGMVVHELNRISHFSAQSLKSVWMLLTCLPSAQLTSQCLQCSAFSDMSACWPFNTSCVCSHQLFG